jgi:hypothetical protein
LGEVSRPEALAFAGREIVVIPARPKRSVCPGGPDCPTQVADAKGSAPIPAKVWPAAAPLPSMEGALPPLLRDEPSVFAFAPLDAGLAIAAKPGIPGSLRILPAHLAAMTPVTFTLM